MRSVARRVFIFFAIWAVALVTACGGGARPGPEAASATGGHWPRTITDAVGDVAIPTAPRRIVSTSPVLAGTLLALEAPLIGTGASKPGGVGLDDQGQFTHWGPLAKQRGVQALYQNSQIDLEAVAAADPDLIVVSKTGGDSQIQAVDQLRRMAPVVVFDYNTVGWEEITRQMGAATGLEAKADQLLADYGARVDRLKTQIAAPSTPVQVIVFQPSGGSAFAKPGGPHDRILKRLGLTLDPTDLTAANNGLGGKARGDFVFLSEESSIAALKQRDVLLVGGDEKDLAAVRTHPAYSVTPAVKEGRIVPLGLPSFKLDYYSALDMAEHIARGYGR